MTIDLTPLKANDYWNNIVGIATANNQPIEVLEKELEQIYELPALKTIPEGLPRLLQAGAIVMARQGKDLIVKVETYKVRILSTEAPKTITKKDSKKKTRLSSALAFAQSSKSGAKMALAQITFYEKNADIVADIKEGETYEVLLGGGFKDGTYKLSGDHRSVAGFKKPVVIEVGSPWSAPINELIAKIYPRVPMSQLKTKVGKYVMVQGTVVMSNTRNNKKGGSFGQYTLIDETLSAEAISKGGAVGVMCNAEQVKYGPDSKIIVLGNVTNSPQYGLGLGGFNVVVIPIIAFPYVTEEETNSDTSGAAAVDFSEFADEEDKTPAKGPSVDEFAA